MKKSRLYILVALAATAIVLLLIWYETGISEDTPAVVLPTASVTAPSDNVPLSTETLPPSVVVSPDTVQYAIRTLSRAESYSRSMIVELFWEGGSSMSTLDAAVRGDKCLVAETVDGVTKYSLLADGQLSVWYSDSDEILTIAADISDLSDSYQRILSYEDILSIDPADIIEAGYVEYEGENCIRTVYTAGELGYTYEVYISVSSGLLAGAEVRDGELLVYSMTSVTTDLTTPGDALFTLPPAKDAEQ